MTKEQIEGSKLIAEFDDSVVFQPNENVFKYRRFNQEWALEGLKYHSSWGWLMPVVEKIARIEIKDCPVMQNGEVIFYDSYYPRTFGMISSETKEFMFRFNRFPLFYAPTLIEAVWKAVVYFIKDYNKNKPQ